MVYLNGSSSSDHDGEIFEARQRAAKKTKNLEAYVAWFNRLSFLVATTVCQVSFLSEIRFNLKFAIKRKLWISLNFYDV